MKNNIKKIISYILGASLVIGGVVFAGSLNPSVSTDTANFVTLEDLYQKTQNFSYSLPSHDVSTSSEVAPSMHTLKDIWDSLSNITLPAESDVRENTNYGINNSATGLLVAFSVTSITPSQVGHGNDLSNATITGTGFEAGAVVKLTKSGQTDIICSNTGVTPTQISGISCTTNTFDVGSWNIVVVNSSNTSGLVDGFTIGTTVPGAPTIGTATAGNGQASITFTAPANNGGSAITNYEYTIDDGVAWTAFNPVDTTSPVVVTGLTNGTEYSIKLRAVNSIGSGSASDAVTVTPNATVVSLPYVMDADGYTKLYVYPEDNSAGAVWGCYGTSIGAAAQSNIDGSANTIAIVSGCSELNIAAKICSDLSFGGYDDWYLPAKYQLNAMYTQKNSVNIDNYAGSPSWTDFASDNYWSSTEDSDYPAGLAWIQDFNYGSQVNSNKGDNYRVRCVR